MRFLLCLLFFTFLFINPAHSSSIGGGGAISELGDVDNVEDSTRVDGECVMVQADLSYANEACPGAAGGEDNTASNLGAGTGVYETKDGIDLRFNSLVSQNNRLTISEDDANDEIDFTVNEGNIDHDSLANTHNLTTDIDHDQLTNFTITEHFTMLDEDNFASDSNTQAATQQSIAAYLATQIAAITHNASQIQGVSVEAFSPGAGEDEYVLTYDHDDTRMELKPTTGGSPISGATDNRIVRADVANALQDSPLEIADTTGNLTNTYTAGDWTIKPDDVSSGAAPGVLIESGSSTDVTAVDAGDITLFPGAATTLGFHGDINLKVRSGSATTRGEVKIRDQADTAYQGFYQGYHYYGTALSAYNFAHQHSGSHLYFLSSGGVQLIDYTSARMKLLNGYDITWTDGSGDIGATSGVLTRPANAYVATSVNLATDTGESGYYDVGEGAGASSSGYKVAGTQVVGSQVTGYTDPTGSVDRGTFATSSVTTEDLAEFVFALYTDLKGHGLVAN